MKYNAVSTPTRDQFGSRLDSSTSSASTDVALNRNQFGTNLSAPLTANQKPKRRGKRAGKKHHSPKDEENMTSEASTTSPVITPLEPEEKSMQTKPTLSESQLICRKQLFFCVEKMYADTIHEPYALPKRSAICEILNKLLRALKNLDASELFAISAETRQLALAPTTVQRGFFFKKQQTPPLQKLCDAVCDFLNMFSNQTTLNP